MTTVRVLMDASSAARRGFGSHPKVSLLGESGRRFELSLAPMVTRDGLAPRFSTLDRVGRTPLTVKAGYQLQSHTLEMAVVGRDSNGFLDSQVSVEAQIRVLEEMAASGERVRWEGYGPAKAGWYLITELSVEDVTLQHGSNETTQARVSLTLTRHEEAFAHVGPVTGGAAPPAAAPGPAPEVSGPSGGGSQTYTVARGDTLSGISAKFYGTTGRWQQIADANGITNPKTLAVGKVLTIPPK